MHNFFVFVASSLEKYHVHGTSGVKGTELSKFLHNLQAISMVFQVSGESETVEKAGIVKCEG